MDSKETLKRKIDFTQENESATDVLHENSLRLTLADDINQRLDRIDTTFTSSHPDIGSAQNDLRVLSEFANDSMFVCNRISSFCFIFFVFIDFECFL